jgi:splicing factor 3B subunit 2
MKILQKKKKKEGVSVFATNMTNNKSAAQKKAEQKKRAKENKRAVNEKLQSFSEHNPQQQDEEDKVSDKNNNIEIDYVAKPLAEAELPEEMRDVFSRFVRLGAPNMSSIDRIVAEAKEAPGAADAEAEANNNNNNNNNDNSNNNNHKNRHGDGGEDGTLSMRKKKELLRPSIAELKQTVERPDVVDPWDTAAADPLTLVYLKAYRNTVPVPRHWNQKRKYLQNKRGYDKPPFRLPDYLQKTGVEALMGKDAEAEADKTNQRLAKERTAPKGGRWQIDFQVLIDAFFKHQTKPEALTIMGDQYYEGKELEPKTIHKTPGVLSSELRAALGIPPGAPPPWLLNMQRIGPPPAYPRLRIPGLNAPIPAGASWGFHPGGWGQAPVDEAGNPLHGDVSSRTTRGAAEVDRTRFGEFRTDYVGAGGAGGGGGGGGGAGGDGASGVVIPAEAAHTLQLQRQQMEEQEAAKQRAAEREARKAEYQQQQHGEATPGSQSVVPGAGLQTPSTPFDLRKTKGAAAFDKAQAEKAAAAKAGPAAASGTPGTLYTVLETKAAPASAGAGIMGAYHSYDMSALSKKKVETTGTAQVAERFDVALDPEMLEKGDKNQLLAEMVRKEKAEKETAKQLAEKEREKDDNGAGKKRKKDTKDATKDAKKFKF